jgi:hypothetical protein
VLPFESRSDFEKLWADLRAEFTPRGCLEEHSVYDLAYLRWLKQRVKKAIQAAFHEDPFTSDLIDSGKKSWRAIRQDLRRQAKNNRSIGDTMHRGVAELSEQLTAAAARLCKVDLEPSQIDKAHGNLDFLVTLINDRLMPVVQLFEQGPSAERTLKQAYSLEFLEPLIRQDAAIDARIDKTLARIIALKEYKRVAATYVPRLLPLDPPAASNVNEAAMQPIGRRF